jgi:uncharacterized protein YjbJ (UPF0337 family)
LIKKQKELGTRVAEEKNARAMGARLHLRECQMNWDRVEGNWKQLKGKVKEQWGKLTDDQIDQIGGRKDQLVGKLQEEYGISKDEAEKQIDAFGTRYEDYEPEDLPRR